VIAAIGNGAAFVKGREFSAWLGVVPGNTSPAALANKLARMAWAVLAKNEEYRSPLLVTPTAWR